MPPLSWLYKQEEKEADTFVQKYMKAMVLLAAKRDTTLGFTKEFLRVHTTGGIQ